MTTRAKKPSGKPAAKPKATKAASNLEQPERRVLADRARSRQPDSNDFAAVKSGLDSYRSNFYGQSRQTANTGTDATRRERSLTGGSGDRILTPLDLWIEREISRHLAEHSPIYEGIIATWAAETVQNGFRLKPKTGDDALNTQVKEVMFGWDGDGGWCSECDARGLGHFWDVITLSEETEFRDGDHAFYLDKDGNNGRGSVAIIEGDRILTPYGATVAEGYTISNGIVWNSSGYPVSVFVADVCPEWAYCSVENGRFHDLFKPWAPELGGVVLSIDLKRASGTRRAPWLATAIRTHDEIDDVFVAVRIAMRNIACRSTYTKIEDWEAYREWLELVDPSVSAPAPTDGLTHTPNPGDHTNTNPGESMGVLESNIPGTNFEPFMQLQLGTIGLPVGMCMEEAVRIFQKSFSSSRMAINGTRLRYERRQRRIKRRKVTPLLSFGIACNQKVGKLPKDPRCNRILCGFPGWPYMEPLKDAQASQTLVDARLRSRRTCATEIGDDYDDENPLIQEEDELWPPVDGGTAPKTNMFVDAGGGQ